MKPIMLNLSHMEPEEIIRNLKPSSSYLGSYGSRHVTWHPWQQRNRASKHITIVKLAVNLEFIFSDWNLAHMGHMGA